MQITVRGSAEVSARPERAELYLSVQLTGGDKKQVVNASVTAANQVREQVDLLPNGVVTELVIETLSTTSHTPRDDSGNLMPTRYTARVPLRVTFTDFEELSRFAATLGVREETVLHGVRWVLTEQSRQELEVRALAQAVATARTRAVIMASASGFSEVTPVAVADPNLLDASPPPAAPMAASMRGAAGGGAGDLDPEALDLRPEDVTLTAAVDARFAAS